MSNSSLPEFKFLNQRIGAQAWQIDYNEDYGYLISAKMPKELREKIKQLVVRIFSNIMILEDATTETLSFNRKEIIALLKKNHPLNHLERVIKNRRSGYHFDPQCSISDELLERVFNAARLAPSAYNEQPWRFIACNKFTDPYSYSKLYELLPQHTKPWIGNAPVLVIIITAIKDLDNTPTGTIQVSNNRWTLYDTGAAAVSMMLVATSLGLMAHQVGGFEPDKVSKFFAIENGFKPLAVMAIGYNTEKELPTKPRKPLNEILFKGQWGKS